MVFISGFILPTQQRKNAQRHKGNVIFFRTIRAFVCLNERLLSVAYSNAKKKLSDHWPHINPPPATSDQQIKSLPRGFSKNLCFTVVFIIFLKSIWCHRRHRNYTHQL